MSKQNRQKEDIGRIGCSMLAAARLTGGEIDEIISNPRLFSSIRESITAGSRVDEASVPSPWLLWQKGLAAAGVSFVFLALGLGVAHLRSFDQLVVTESTVNADPQAIVPAERTPAANPAPLRVDKVIPRVSRVRPPVAPQQRKSLPRAEKEPVMGEFQAIAYREDADGEGERVVRVELPRSSLIAMGIDAPGGRETGTIKADLRIGADGVMTAVRVAEY